MAGLLATVIRAFFVPVFVLGIVYLVSTAIYRLYISPLAKFPGPKLAALSSAYEFYWDAIQPGRLTWHLVDLHKQYGPIVRITPHEVHILDSTFFDELYARPASSTKKQHKDPRTGGRFGFRGDAFSTWQHDTHRLRRNAINPFFSAKRIAELQHLIRGKLTKFAHALKTSHDVGAVVVPLNLGYMALTGDITTEYAFAHSYNQLDSPGFSTSYDVSLKALYVLSNLCLFWPWIHVILDHTPVWITAITSPDVLPMINFHSDRKSDIQQLRTRVSQGHETEARNPTIFHELLNTKDLPDDEKTEERLSEEAIEIVAAGIITTSFALTVGTFHILSNPQILSKLREELLQHFPDPLNLHDLESDRQKLEWHSLEALPYLSGCVRESIRLSGGVVARSPRIFPNNPTIYRQHTIPAGTTVSMTSWHVAHDPDIFPDPDRFEPERWINTNTSSGTSTRNVEMDRWIVAFGKGTRQCAGINLAFAELYLTLAFVFRSFDMELYETGCEDVEVVHAYFVPYPKFESKGVRVRIRGLLP